MEELTRTADALMGQNRWAEAEQLFLRSRERAEQTGSPSLELSICSELLGFYRMGDNPSAFEPVWRRTLELLASVRPEAASRGTILVNGATALTSFGRAAEAMPYFHQAEDCFLNLPAGDPRLAALLNNMAAARESLGDLAGAGKLIRRAVAVLRIRGLHPDIAVSYVNLAQLCARQPGEELRAEEYLDAAMAVLDDPALVWDSYYAHTARKCAGAFTALGRPEQGQDLEERAALIYEGT